MLSEREKLEILEEELKQKEDLELINIHNKIKKRIKKQYQNHIIIENDLDKDFFEEKIYV